MDYKATLMVLVLVSSTLAGCTGDPDGGGGDEIDSDALQDLFDEHFQDFLNNTTITVINNYHNNTTYVVDDGDYSTTVVNEYNNTTINEGDETSTNNYQTDNDYSSSNYSLGGSVVGVNGTTGGIIYMIDVTFTIDDVLPQPEPAPDYRNNTIDYDYSYYDYLTNSERTDTFTIQCSDYYLVGSQSSNNSFEVPYWEDSSNYWSAWVDQYNQTIANMLQEAAYDYYEWPDENYAYHVRIACDENYLQDTSNYNNLVLAEIVIPEGYAFACHYRSYGGGAYPSESLYRWSTTGGQGNSSFYTGGHWESFNWYSEQSTKFIYGDSWVCSRGMVGGNEDTIMTVAGHYQMDMDDDILYRYVMYYELIPVVNME
jgi:hypothetical protein